MLGDAGKSNHEEPDGNVVEVAVDGGGARFNAGALSI